MISRNVLCASVAFWKASKFFLRATISLVRLSIAFQLGLLFSQKISFYAAMDIAELLLGPLTVETDTASSKMEEGDDDVMKKDIRELKENVQKMMGQMGQLLEVITRVEALSTKVNKNEECVKKVEEMVKEDRDEIKL